MLLMLNISEFISTAGLFQLYVRLRPPEKVEQVTQLLLSSGVEDRSSYIKGQTNMIPDINNPAQTRSWFPSNCGDFTHFLPFL